MNENDAGRSSDAAMVTAKTESATQSDVAEAGDQQTGPYTRAQIRDYSSAPCPRCGAPTVVNWIDVSTVLVLARDEPMFLPGLRDCSARCRDAELVAYLDGPGYPEEMGNP